MGRETELGVCFCKWFAMYCEEKNIRLYEENECQRRRSSPVCVRRSIIVRRTIIVILRNQLVLLFLSIICHRIVASTWFMDVTKQRTISSRGNNHSLHFFHSVITTLELAINCFFFICLCFWLMFAVSKDVWKQDSSKARCDWMARSALTYARSYFSRPSHVKHTVACDHISLETMGYNL